MTFLSYVNYRWCDSSGDWHSGYPDSSCTYTQVQGCNLWGQWSDCTPAPKLDGIVEGTTGNDLIDYNYTGDPEGDKIDHNDSTDYKDNDDLVQAFAGNDTVLAGAGRDTVYGGEGNDSLNGQDSDDKLYGEAGHDTLVGGAGCNTLDGGSGDDVFIGGAGSDTFIGGAGQDNLDYSASTSGVTVNLSTGAMSGGLADNDEISSGIDGVIGSNSADSLTGFDHQGTAAADTYTNQFWGNGGNDTITGLGGNDQIYGGADQDKLYGGAGHDTIEGGSGNDLITGGLDNDLIDGGTGADTIYGDEAPASGSPVTITLTGDGGAYSDNLFAYSINPVTGAITNVQVLTTNSDVSVGCVYTYNVAPGTVMGVGIISPDGTFYSSGYGSNIGLNGDSAVHTKGLGVNSDGSVNIGFEDLKNLGDKDFNDVTVKVNLGTSGATFDNAHYTYTSTAPAGSALGGHDTITAGDGHDLVYGGAGNDVLSGQNDNDTLNGDKGDDTIIGGSGNDLMAGGDDRDMFVGGNAGDVVDGNEGGIDNDTLDLSGSGPLKIIYDALNPENGTVQFLDPTERHVVGTMTFTNIENVIPCFTPGTLIATPRGEVPVESLRIGDRIITRDNGMQEIRWMGRRDLSWNDLAAAPHLKPILIRQGSLGNGLPERDMMVSPNHRVLVANDRTALYFDEHEVLVAAKHLAAGKGIHSVDAAGASYIHFMCDRHEVVLSNGAWTESFQPGDLTLKGMGNAQRSEIFDLFPELKTDAGIENYGSARRTLKRHEAMLIAK